MRANTDSSTFGILHANEKLQRTLARVDWQVQVNLKRVLSAFRAEKVGAHHFAGVSGYGHDDLGREILDRVFAQVLGAEAAAVRLQFVSGTHAIACALFGCLRPGDRLLAVAGPPYDTLEEVIGLRGQGQGSLADYGVIYEQLDLIPSPDTSQPDLSKPDLSKPDQPQPDQPQTRTVDWAALAQAVTPQTRLVHIQRSCGYDWRPSLTIADIGRIVKIVKAQNPDTICFVDNCYGEFVETQEPCHVGADLVAGSLIKNPGGTIAPAGGYVAGRLDLVEKAAYRLTAPGIGRAGGATFDQNRLLFQGFFLAPQMVGEAVKIAHVAADTFARLGYPVSPGPTTPRTDVIQAIQLGSAAKLQAFCRAIQQWSPIDSYLDPIPDQIPGYADAVIMAGGTFIEGSTLELSADGPLREPYTVYLQGGTHLSHGLLAIEAAVQAIQAL